MNKLTVLLTDAEKVMVENELRRLFALQDANLGNEKRGFFMEEFEHSGLPSGALIAGMRALIQEDIRSLKASVILEHCRRFFTPSDKDQYQPCAICLRGEVTMRDEQGRRYALACSCERGAGLAATASLARWSGEGVQMSRGRALYFLPRVATEDPSKEEQ